MQRVVDIPVGTPIIVELSSKECFSGIMTKVSKDFRRLTLSNISNLKTGTEIIGNQYFYKGDITNVRRLNEDGMANQTNGTSNGDTAEASILKSEELKRIQNNITNATYIKQCDRTYHAAVDELKRADIIAVSVEDERFVRLKEASLLVMCTSENIFIFDIKLLGELFKDIKAILSGPVPRKVVHNGSFIADYLLHRQRCELNGIFDTALAHMQIEQRREMITLQECLRKYLKIPEELINVGEKLDWNSRPLSKERMFTAASKVAYSLKLYFVMAHDILLKPLNDTCLSFSKTFAANKDSVDVFGKISTRQNPGVQHVKMWKLEKFPVA